ncbi:hypothetical protein J5N97_026072 [Dioscorea zingiberensis]|uniref:Uncharacterized protein n=1 Tax=Dioscorea zingiberensis TaxID=325984 RepID=A0A9D5C216_9LILI|nr:hypothetical protein J5N97_026072 [Dioscorea zingiberensis]
MQRAAASFASAALRQLVAASILRPSSSIQARSIISSTTLSPRLDLPIYHLPALDLHRSYARGPQAPIPSEDEEDDEDDVDFEGEDGDLPDFEGEGEDLDLSGSEAEENSD